MLGLCIAVTITPASDYVFDVLENAHASNRKSSFTARSVSEGMTDTKGRVDVSYRWPNEFRVKTYRPNTNTLLRDVAIEPSRTVNFDSTLKQYTTEKRKTDESVVDLAIQMQEGLEPLILAFVAPNGIKDYVSGMRADRGWKTTASKNKLTLTLDNDKGSIELEIDRRKFLLTQYKFAVGFENVRWTIDYDSSPKSTRFNAPSGAYKVPVFDRDTKLPTYADSRARALTEKVFAAYSDLTSIGYKLEREDGLTTVFMYKGFVKQDDPLAEWTYDGKTLLYHNKKTGFWYQGDVSFVEVIDALGNLRSRVDPTVMLLMRGFNPYRRRLGDGAHIRLMGSLPMPDNTQVTMLSAESDNAFITLYVRDSDGMVVSTITRGKEASTNPGNVELKFEYFEVSSNVETEQKLVAPAGTTLQSVQRILSQKPD